MDKLNVFVLGLNDANLKELAAIPDADRYAFHPVLNTTELQEGEIPIDELLDRARARLDAFPGSVDAIAGYWDFPVSSMVPILAAERGLPSAPLRAITTCEHKYWSRLEQRKVVADEVPPFGLVDTENDTGPPDAVEYPIWLKPIKGFSSELAYRVTDDEEFAEAVATIRKGLDRVGEPFAHVLEQLDLPPEIAAIGPHHCLAEHAMSGDQVATEGYVYRGEINVYGVLDSVNYPDSPVFLRHQYPSQLPDDVCRRLKEASAKVIGQIGLDNSTFSIEFFHHPDSDRICLLEVNPRHSQSHAALFQRVDGVPNHHVMVSLALGEDPCLEQGRGEYRIAAMYNHRRFDGDGVVRSVPGKDDVRAIEAEVPGVDIYPKIGKGQQLSDLAAQDSYSFELTDVVVAADSVPEMEEKYARVIKALHYEIDDVEEPSSGA